jgi:hypothetical protein
MLTGATGLAAASRAPTSAERAVIVKTATESRLLVELPKGSFAVNGVRVSTVATPGRRYARLNVVRKPADAGDRATGVVRRLRGHWRLIDLGTSGVGCRTVPARVRADLKLICP